MRNQTALRVVFQQEAVSAKIETPKVTIQQQRPRYASEADRQLAIQQQQQMG